MSVIVQYRPTVPLSVLQSNFDLAACLEVEDKALQHALARISTGAASNLPAQERQFDSVEEALSWAESTPEVEPYQLIEDGLILVNEIEEIPATEWRAHLAHPPPSGFKGHHAPFRRGRKWVPRAPGAAVPPSTPSYGRKYGPLAQR